MTSLAVQIALKENPIAREFLLFAALRHESQMRKAGGIKPHKRVRLMIGHGIFSLDHLIRPREHVSRNRNADLFCGLQIDHQFKLGRLLDRQIRGLGTLENLST
jgi:hypothetical protein